MSWGGRPVYSVVEYGMDTGWDGSTDRKTELGPDHGAL